MFCSYGFISSGGIQPRRFVPFPGIPDPDPEEPPDYTESPIGGNATMAALVPLAEATHISNGTGGGDWSSTSTWDAGTIPGAGDKVVIREGDEVTYDVNETDRIKWILVDGDLTWEASASSTYLLTVDTMIISMAGTMTCGTVASPVPASTTCTIAIANNGAVDLSYDPTFVSRGLINMGTLIMHGAAKTPFVEMGADASSSATALTLASSPSGWENGDQLVVTANCHHGWGYDGSGTSYRGHQDHETTISGISGTALTLADGLNRQRVAMEIDDPDGRWSKTVFRPHVVNYTRNVRIVTENAGSVPDSERGHVMMMGGMADFDIRYVEFYELGRTRKSAASTTSVSNNNTNVKGRYPFHQHFMGITQDKQIAQPSLVGCSVWKSPGWGIVQHGSAGNWYLNATYGCYGAGFVGEDGVETGTWKANIAVWCRGNHPSENIKNGVFSTKDAGNMGEGFSMLGRMVRARDNIACSCHMGYTFFTRSGNDFQARIWQIPEVLDLDDDTNVDRAPINHWDNNLSYACHVGLEVVKDSPFQGHEYWTQIDSHVAVNCLRGYFVEYTGKYLLKNLVYKMIPASDRSGLGFYNAGGRYGLSLGPNSFDFTILNCDLEGSFTSGLHATHNLANIQYPPTDWNYTLIGVNFINNTQDWQGFDASKGDQSFANIAALPGNALSTTVHQQSYTYGTSFSKIFGSGIILSGTITDTIGTRDVDEFDINAVYRDADLDRFMGEFGYWQDGGTNVMFVPYWVTDRVPPSGGNHPNHLVVPIKVTVGGNATGTNNGSWVAGGDGFTKSGGLVSTGAASTHTEARIDVMTGVTDDDARGTPILLGVNRTNNADIFIDRGAGEIVYISDFGFTGDDEFDYWIWNGADNIERVTMTVTVS